jgi:hypothetical protein
MKIPPDPKKLLHEMCIIGALTIVVVSGVVLLTLLGII